MTKMVSYRAISLCFMALAKAATAFVPSVRPAGGLAAATTTLQQRTTIPENMPKVVRTRGERSGSFNTADTTTSSPAINTKRRTFGWLQSSDSRATFGTGGAAPIPQRKKAALSKLFATPQPALSARRSGLPLVGIVSRTCLKGVQGSCGCSPIFLAMCALCARFAPALAAQSVLAWAVGHLAYGWSMRGADVSQRLPAGMFGYTALFLLVGGLSFLNGLKAVALLA